MAKSVVVIGAGGHSRSVIGVLHDLDYEVLGIYDDAYDSAKNEMILGVPVAGIIDDCPINVPVVLAIGSNSQRAEQAQQFGDRIISKSIIHPSATVHSSVQFGKANTVFPTAFINAAAKIGDNNIINSGSIIEHESVIGNHCHVSIGSIVAGRVAIGDRCFIGAGAVVKDQLSICADVTIGAGAVVVKDITEPGTYIGNPLKKLR